MADTIEWLETIGMNANLRRAPAGELAEALALTDASDALKEAVVSGDRTVLSVELGYACMKTEHNINGPAHEEEPEDDEEAPTEPGPDQH